MTRYLVFTVVGLALVLVSISGSSVSVAFPQITAEFNANLILAGWVLNVNQLVCLAVMPLAGKIGDILGRKKVFLIAISLFTVGSLFCALAPNIYLLIGSRFIQSIGAGAFLPLATAIVADEFAYSRQKWVGFISSLFPIGQIIGPNVGGWLTATYGWQATFWFNIPFAMLVLVAAVFLVKSGEKGSGNIDMVGAGLFTAGMFAFVTALSEIGTRQGALSWLVPVVLLAAAGVFMYLFIKREGKVEEPIIELQLLKKRPFMAANIYNFIFGACVLGTLAFVPLYAVEVYGMSTLASGVILTPRSIAMIAASVITSICLPKWGYRKPMLIGTAIMVFSLIMLGLEPESLSIGGLELNSTILVGIVMLLSGIGMGISVPAANNACIELMPNRIATITGVRGLFRQSGGAVFIALITLVLSHIGDYQLGFSVVFYGMAAVLLLSIPFVFAMPKAP